MGLLYFGHSIYVIYGVCTNSSMILCMCSVWTGLVIGQGSVCHSCQNANWRNCLCTSL